MRKYLSLILVIVSVVDCSIYSDDGGPDATHRLVWLSPDPTPVLAGQELPPIRVRIDNAVEPTRMQVRWRILAGGGVLSDSITPVTAASQASVRWTVGTTGAQVLEASTAFLEGDSITVRYTARIGRLEITNGDSQHVSFEDPTLAPLWVRWTDYAGNPIAAQPVEWRTEMDGVTLDGQTSTNAQGGSENRVAYAAGQIGRPGRITAYMFNNPSDRVEFTVLTDHRLRLVSGGNQLGSVGSALPSPIVVAFDNPTDGEAGPPTAFHWEVLSGGGSVRYDNIVSSRTSSMENVWTLGSTVGTQSLRIYQTDGFGRDTIVVTATASAAGASGCGGSGTLHDAGSQVLTSQTWTIAGSPHIVRGQVTFGPNANLTIDPGVTVCLEGNAGLNIQGVLRAVGTPATPIRFAAADTTQPWGNIVLSNTSGTLNEISNARISHGYTPIVAGAPVRIDSTIIRQSSNFAIMIDNAWSTNRVIHTTVDTTGSLSNSAVLIGAPDTDFRGTVRGSAGPFAVLINKVNVTLQDCTVSGNSGGGVVVDAVNDVRIGNCNLTANGGLAVRSSGILVDARSNWWGNPAGPALGGANGISANVDASSPRIGEIDVGYRPTW